MLEMTIWSAYHVIIEVLETFFYSYKEPLPLFLCLSFNFAVDVDATCKYSGESKQKY